MPNLSDRVAMCFALDAEISRIKNGQQYSEAVLACCAAWFRANPVEREHKMHIELTQPRGQE